MFFHLSQWSLDALTSTFDLSQKAEKRLRTCNANIDIAMWVAPLPNGILATALDTLYLYLPFLTARHVPLEMDLICLRNLKLDHTSVPILPKIKGSFELSFNTVSYFKYY